MPRDINVVIITAHCSKTGNRMGIRLEEKSRRHWVADWAFKIKESVASKEGYDKSRVDGQFEFSHEFLVAHIVSPRALFFAIARIFFAMKQTLDASSVRNAE